MIMNVDGPWHDTLSTVHTVAPRLETSFSHGQHPPVSFERRSIIDRVEGPID